MRNRYIYALLVLGNMFWGCSFPLTKMVVDYVPRDSFIFFRFLTAAILLWIIIRAVPSVEKPKLSDLKKENIGKLLPAMVSGFLGIFMYQFLFFMALERTTAINSSIIGALNPVMTIIIGAVFAHQYINKKMALGVGISFVGAVFTICGANIAALTGFQFNSGDLLMLAGTGVWAIYNVYCQSKCSHFNALVLTFWNFVTGMVFAFPLALAEKPWEWIGSVPFSSWAALFCLAAFASVGAYCIQFYAITKIGSARTSIFVNLMPFFSMMASVILIGEELEPVKVLTAFIIVAGVIICQKYGRRPDEIIHSN
ncbi:MAG: DMT family transporter [Firmicutes bacterium]|nr:DMT family transporter [Bacillota bacterium]